MWNGDRTRLEFPHYITVVARFLLLDEKCKKESIEPENNRSREFHPLVSRAYLTTVALQILLGTPKNTLILPIFLVITPALESERRVEGSSGRQLFRTYAWCQPLTQAASLPQRRQTYTPLALIKTYHTVVQPGSVAVGWTANTRAPFSPGWRASRPLRIPDPNENVREGDGRLGDSTRMF